ncbi:MAG: outer membrane beta-barrel protein [Bacteroidota bacterium]
MSDLRKVVCLVLTVFFILIAFDADAQKYRKRYNKRGPNIDIRVGLRAGANYATFSGDQFAFVRENGIQVSPFPERTYDFTIGFHAGAYMDIMFKRNVHIQPEINYTRIGSSFSTPIGIVNPMGGAPILKSFETESSIDYVQLGLLSKIGLGRNNKFRFIIGPGVLFKNSELIAFTYPTEVSEEDRLNSPTFNVYSGTDIIAMGGFEYQMDIGVSIGLRFSQGFFDVHESPVNADFQPIVLQPLEVMPENFNRYLSLSIGYSFNHYKRLFHTRKGRRFTFKKRRF